MLLEIFVNIIVSLGLIFFYHFIKNYKEKQQITNEPQLLNEPYKMVMCVRNDLKMGKGKIAAQCGHAAVGCVLKAQQVTPKALSKWREYGQAKVALKIDSLDQLFVE